MHNKVVHPLFQVSRIMSQSLNQHLAVHGLTHMQLAVIEFLKMREESTSLVDIAKYLSVEKSTVTRTVKQLEKLGFVQHMPSDDSREKRIVLGAQYAVVQEELQETKEAFEEKAFHNISPEEMERTYATLLKIMKNFNGAD